MTRRQPIEDRHLASLPDFLATALHQLENAEAEPLSASSAVMSLSYVREVVDGLMQPAIDAARAHGATWSEVAGWLYDGSDHAGYASRGTWSKQRAQQRYGRKPSARR